MVIPWLYSAKVLVGHRHRRDNTLKMIPYKDKLSPKIPYSAKKSWKKCLLPFFEKVRICYYTPIVSSIWKMKNKIGDGMGDSVDVYSEGGDVGLDTKCIWDPILAPYISTPVIWLSNHSSSSHSAPFWAAKIRPFNRKDDLRFHCGASLEPNIKPNSSNT